MTEKVEATQTLEIPSSKDSQEETQTLPQAETMIAAAVQTGAAAQAAETAASQATQAATEAKDLLTQIREEIRAELSPINERLATLEAEEAEEAEESITPDEEEGTLAVVSAETVTLEEPQKQKEEIQTKQSETPESRNRGGGLLKKLFLNM